MAATVSFAAVSRCAAAILLVLIACGGSERPAASPPPGSQPVEMTLISPDFPEGGSIPARFTCDGEDVAPRLEWSGVPEDTAELAIQVIDPDANGFVHWTVRGIDPSVTDLDPKSLPAGIEQETNGFGKQAYGGPCPPEGRHTYVFTIYALAVKGDPLERGELGRAVLTATYER